MTDEHHDEEAVTLGRRLRSIREKSYLPQEAVSAAIGVPRSGVSDIENGRRRLDVFEAARLAALHEMPLEALLYGEQRPTAQPWEPRSVHRDGGWHRLPKVLIALIDDESAYEQDADDVIDIGAGPTDAGTPHLNVWQRAEGDRYAALPLFEITLTGGPMYFRVYASAHRDLLYLLRELSPIMKDLNVAQLASLLTTDEARDEIVGGIFSAIEGARRTR